MKAHRVPMSLVLLAALTAHRAGAAPQPHDGPTETFLPLHIIYNPDALALHEGTLTQMLGSERLQAQLAALAAELKLPTPPLLRYTESARFGRPLGQDDGIPQETLIGFVSARWSDEVDPSAAAPLLRQAVASLAGALDALTMQSREHAQAQVELARRQMAEAERGLQELHERQQVMLAEAGVYDLTRERVVSLVRELEGTRDNLRANLVGLNARRESVARQIADLTRHAQDTADAAGVVKELETVVQIRERLLGEAQRLAEKGLATQSDIDRAAEPLAQARAELARERRAALQSPAGALALEFNHELIRIAVEISEQEARLAFVTSRLKEVDEKNLLARASQFELTVVSRLPIAQERLASTARALHAAERRLDTMRIPPVVKLIEE